LLISLVYLEQRRFLGETDFSALPAAAPVARAWRGHVPIPTFGRRCPEWQSDIQRCWRALDDLWLIFGPLRAQNSSRGGRSARTRRPGLVREGVRRAGLPEE
jgi:hypothetical protein